jgi:hypothetical protein
MPAKKEMPETIQRSAKHARDIWSKAHDSAVESYGEGERGRAASSDGARQGREDRIGGAAEGTRGPSGVRPVTTQALKGIADASW